MIRSNRFGLSGLPREPSGSYGAFDFSGYLSGRKELFCRIRKLEGKMFRMLEGGPER